ncbi:hypothetical protein Plhal304r1_c030g0097391 [Plasmopara halstedii]
MLIGRFETFRVRRHFPMAQPSMSTKRSTVVQRFWDTFSTCPRLLGNLLFAPLQDGVTAFHINIKSHVDEHFSGEWPVKSSTVAITRL